MTISFVTEKVTIRTESNYSLVLNLVTQVQGLAIMWLPNVTVWLPICQISPFPICESGGGINVCSCLRACGNEMSFQGFWGRLRCVKGEEVQAADRGLQTVYIIVIHDTHIKQTNDNQMRVIRMCCDR